MTKYRYQYKGAVMFGTVVVVALLAAWGMFLAGWLGVGVAVVVSWLAVRPVYNFLMAKWDEIDY